MHLHAVVDDAPTTHEPLPVHSYFFDAQLLSETGWPTLTIGTAVDPSLAPPGKQVGQSVSQLAWAATNLHNSSYNH